jgi:hypothetical protein
LNAAALGDKLENMFDNMQITVMGGGKEDSDDFVEEDDGSEEEGIDEHF